MTSESGGRLADLPAAALRAHPGVVAAFEALNRSRVRWCLLRGEARLEAPPHDVDLLVAPADLGRLMESLRPLGFVPVPTWGRGTHRFLVAHERSSPEWFLLDVVTELAYGPAYAIRTDAAGACLARREAVGPLRLLCADDAFWTLLLHCLLDRGEVRAHQLERLRALLAAARPDGMLARFAESLCPPGWDALRLMACVRTEGGAGLAGVGAEMVRRWGDRHPVGFRLRRSADALRWRFAPVHRTLTMRGLRVVLADHDGALAASVAAGLAGRFYLPATVLAPGGELRALYHQARGRLVVVPLAARNGRTARRADLLILLERDGAGTRPVTPRSTSPVGARVIVACAVEEDDADLRRVRGLVLHTIWQEYARRRRWGPGA